MQSGADKEEGGGCLNESYEEVCALVGRCGEEGL